MAGARVFQSSLACWIGPLLFVACIDHNGDGTDAVDADAEPAVQVTPQYLNFGVWSQEDGALQEEFTIRNVGGSDLDVISVEISGYAAGTFSLVGGAISLTLPPDTEEVLVVEFAPPNAGEHTANVIVTSDTATPKVAVELYGTTAQTEDDGDSG